MRYLIWIIAITILALGLWWANSAMDNNLSTNITSEELEVETADLKAVGGYTGSGIATRSFDGQVFTHTVEANLDTLKTGKFYEGWLVVPSPLDFFSTGRLEKSGSKWELTYTSNQDESRHASVVITEETLANGFDGISETHVLEGSF